MFFRIKCAFPAGLWSENWVCFGFDWALIGFELGLIGFELGLIGFELGLFLATAKVTNFAYLAVSKELTFIFVILQIGFVLHKNVNLS